MVFFYQTYTGRHLKVEAPSPLDVSINDIAHHLSLECRFGGAVETGYSVAEHSVRVAREFPESRRDLRLQGLIHDAPEYVLKDIPRPLRNALGSAYTDLYEKWWRAIVAGLSLPFDEISAEVLDADDRLLATEARDLLPGCGREWSGVPTLIERIEPWGARKAEEEFLKEWRFCWFDTVRIHGRPAQLRNLAGTAESAK